MKTIIITLAALATLSTASLASQRTDVDARDRIAGDVNSVGSSYTAAAGNLTSDSAAFAVEDIRTTGLSSYDRVMQQSISNENSSNNN